MRLLYGRETETIDPSFKRREMLELNCKGDTVVDRIATVLLSIGSVVVISPSCLNLIFKKQYVH